MLVYESVVADWYVINLLPSTFPPINLYHPCRWFSWYEQITITTTLPLLGALSSPTMASLCTMPASTGTSFLLSSLASLSMVSSKFLSQRLQIGIIGIFAFFLCVRSVCSDYNCSLCWAGTTSFSKVALPAILWNYWKKNMKKYLRGSSKALATVTAIIDGTGRSAHISTQSCIIIDWCEILAIVNLTIISALEQRLVHCWPGPSLGVESGASSSSCLSSLMSSVFSSFPGKERKMNDHWPCLPCIIYIV